jgi:hypothetical protein
MYTDILKAKVNLIYIEKLSFFPRGKHYLFQL